MLAMCEDRGPLRNVRDEGEIAEILRRQLEFATTNNRRPVDDVAVKVIVRTPIQKPMTSLRTRASEFGISITRPG